MLDFHTLIDDAERRPFIGWDTRCEGRITTHAPWDFTAIVAAHAHLATDLLDLGTGSGEWLSQLPARPQRTVATEGWAPNLPIARARLEPLGIAVVAVDGAPDNTEQDGEFEGGALPFADASFQLVVSRHESFVASEIARVLAPGGCFLTQQVASGGGDAYRLFGATPPAAKTWDLTLATAQLTAAGLRIERQADGFETITFADVGALAWYLKNLPGVFPDFSIDAARPQLERLHQRIGHEGPLRLREPLFWLAARKPE